MKTVVTRVLLQTGNLPRKTARLSLNHARQSSMTIGSGIESEMRETLDAELAASISKILDGDRIQLYGAEYETLGITTSRQTLTLCDIHAKHISIIQIVH